jgi:outer membrane protein assembly factor BamB
VFVGSDDGVVYSMDAKSGCAYWAYRSDMFGRFAPIVAPISGYPGTRYAIFFVTRSSTAYAIDAHTGKLLWKNEVKDGLNNLSATAAYYDGRLYVPLAGTETLTGGNLDYECCKSRGTVVAVDANTGGLMACAEYSGATTRDWRELPGKQMWDRGGFGVEHPHRETRNASSSMSAPATVSAHGGLHQRFDLGDAHGRRKDCLAPPGVCRRCVHERLPPDECARHGCPEKLGS